MFINPDFDPDSSFFGFLSPDLRGQSVFWGLIFSIGGLILSVRGLILFYLISKINEIGWVKAKVKE